MGEAQFAKEREDLRLDSDVERGCGFVGDEELGAIDQGAGDEDALALASGELVGVVAEAALGIWQRDVVHGGDDSGANDLAG